MAIAISCTKCDYRAKVKDELAGKRAKCPRCETVIQIAVAEPSLEELVELAASAPPAASMQAGPNASEAAAISRHAGLTSTSSPVVSTRLAPALQANGTIGAPSPDELTAILQSNLKTPILRRPFSPTYLLATLLTTLLMIMLPIIYVALIGVVIALVRWHMQNNLVMLEAAQGRGAVLVFGAYVAPLVIGLILIVFMVKPLFARPPRPGRRRSLTADEEPVLFDFVRRICELVRAPIPRRIDVTCDINAAAGFRRAWLSLLTGGDLVLTIGMPLVGGLTLRQFGGVLAHEFGHFSQGAGMRLTYIIRSINFWFMRVVYQRDSWDEWLESGSEKLDFRIGWILYVARFFVWLTRKVLWALMMIGHLVAGFMLRQMEYDADYYETQFGGSPSFEATTRQLALLNLAHSRAQSDLDRLFQVGGLADNLAKLTLANTRQIPENVRGKLNEAIDESITSLLDSHPSDSRRIAAAHRRQAAGVFTVDLPASSIFRDFDGTSREVTRDLYIELFGEHIDSQKLNSVDELLRRRERETQASESRKRFFLGCFSPIRPSGLPSGFQSERPSAKELQKTLIAAREQMQSLATFYRDALEQFDQADTTMMQSMQAAALLDAGIKKARRENGSPFSSTKQCRASCEQAQSQQSSLLPNLRPFEAATAQRLGAAIQLLEHSRIGDAVANIVEKRKAAKELLPLVSAISTHLSLIIDLRNYQSVLSVLCSHLSDRGNKEDLAAEIRDAMKRVYERLNSVRDLFTTHAYAFDDGKGKVPVAQYLLKYLPSPKDLSGIHDGANTMVDGLFEIYVRGIDRLCELAEEVEAALGYSAQSPDKID